MDQMQFSKTSDLSDAANLIGGELLRVIQNSGDAKVTVLALLQATMSLAKLTGVDFTNSTPISGDDSLTVALGKIQGQLNKTVMDENVGTAPNQVPVNQLLGRTAFGDVVGAVQVYRHIHASEQGDVWFEYVSDSSLRVKFHGMDDVVRQTTLTLS